MSEGVPDRSELALQRVAALYVHDERGRMTSINQWDGGAPPRFFLMRSAEGVIGRFRADLPDDIAARLQILCDREPLGAPPDRRPLHERAYLEALSRHAPVGQIWAGPSYMFEGPPPADPSPVAIGPHNGDLLRANFQDWLPDVAPRQPFRAIIEDDRAVSICASVRISRAVHCAGVETCADRRNRGHGAKVVAAWAGAVHALGARPCYSTSWDNLASQGLARRLGLSLLGVDFHVV